jgi:integrase
MAISVSPPTDLRALLDDFRADLVGRGRRPRGVAAYLADARRFLNWLCPGRPVAPADLTPVALTRWRNERAASRAPATVHAELCVARAFCRFLVAQGYLEADPTAGIPFPKPRPRIPRALRREQVRTMLAALEIGRLPREHAHTTERARLGVYVFLYTGLRLAEVAALTWGDVDLEGATITVQEGKGGKPRAVPIHPKLEEQLVAAVLLLAPGELRPGRAVIGNRDGSPMHPKSVAEIFTRWLKARGVELTPHQLRHTFATTMLRAGAPLPDIQHALGHASLETTQMYLLVDASHLRRAVGLLPEIW